MKNAEILKPIDMNRSQPSKNQAESGISDTTKQNHKQKQTKSEKFQLNTQTLGSNKKGDYSQEKKVFRNSLLWLTICSCYRLFMAILTLSQKKLKIFPNLSKEKPESHLSLGLERSIQESGLAI